jgi:hypothetical protein
MLGTDPGEWRRAIKATVAGFDPDVEVLIGRGDLTGHYPVRLTLAGCRETLRLYEDQVVAVPTDEAARSAVQQELKEAVALLQLKVEIIRVLQQTQPKRRVAFEGPLPQPGGEVAVALKGAAGAAATTVRARTYGEAVRRLHQQIVKDPQTRP